MNNNNQNHCVQDFLFVIKLMDVRVLVHFPILAEMKKLLLICIFFTNQLIMLKSLKRH